MSLASLYNEAQGNLELTATITNFPGDEIEIGEEFTVRFRGRNLFSGVHGHPHFRNVRLTVWGGPHATPVPGPVLNFDLTNHLGFGGGQATRDVVFRATGKFPDGFLSWPSELYANARITADIDIVEFFQNIEQQKSFYNQIAR